MTKTYTLTITEEQARALQYATDVLQRVQLGQWREIINWLPLKNPIDYEELHQDATDTYRCLLPLPSYSGYE